MYIYIHMYTLIMCIYVYIYIYIHRERERERETYYMYHIRHYMRPLSMEGQGAWRQRFNLRDMLKDRVKLLI